MTVQLFKRIAVLVSIGRHPVSGVARYSRNDALALEAVRLFVADLGLAPAQREIQIDVIHAGDPTNPALSDYLALGAAHIEVLAIEAATDPLPALLARLAAYDLVLCGTRSEGGPGSEDSGMLPYLLAHGLGLPMLGGVLDFALDGGELIVRQFLPKGRRRRIAVSGPVLLAMHPLAGTVPRYAYARLNSGVISTVTSAGASRDTAWRDEPVTAQPRRLAAAEKRSGHARMMAATAAESRGGKVLNEGSEDHKAQGILAYLREHRLIDY